MEKNSKILIAGISGLAGSSIARGLLKNGFTNVSGTYLNRKEQNIKGTDCFKVDLTDYQETITFFENTKPEYVFLAAAKVGGIVANNTYRADFIFQNSQIQNNVIFAAWKTKVKKLLFLGSSCIYPANCPQPIKEEYLLTSELEYTNQPYAIAKIAGILTCESFNIQYNTNFISAMPTNLYGPNDNYDLEKSHVMPALMRKFHLAKSLETKDWEAIKIDLNKRPIEGVNGEHSQEKILEKMAKYGICIFDNRVQLKLWGTGNPKREFMHSDDLADACLFLMQNIDFKDVATSTPIKNTHINIGTGKDLTIKQLAELIQKTTQFSGEIVWDSTKPDGTYQKLLDVSKIKNLGWIAKKELGESIEELYQQYLKN